MRILPFWKRGVSFDAQKDIPPLTGKVIIVTGGTAGLGSQSVLEFARHGPQQIWLAARNLAKSQRIIDAVNKEVPGARISPLELDLTSFESIKKATEIVKTLSGRLDILMLNAGVLGNPRGLTKEDYELHFGTNHVGHALFAKLLLPLLLSTAEEADSDVRVVFLSSDASLIQRTILFDKLKTPCEEIGTFELYGQSKLANALFARELAIRYPQLTVAIIHPGAILTDIAEPLINTYPILRLAYYFIYPLTDSLEVGAQNQLWASVSKDVISGEFYKPVGRRVPVSQYDEDPNLRQELWVWTEDQLKAYGPWHSCDSSQKAL